MTIRQTLESGFNIYGMMPGEEAVDTLLYFLNMLLEKNKVMNLTAIREPEEAVKKHLLDCAYLAKALELYEKKVIDVGCGAGFPGMPLKLVCPDCKMTLLDSLGKRIDFLKECCDKMKLNNIEAVHARAEEEAVKRRESYDIAVSRAVASLNVLSELSLPFVKVGGVFAAMKSTSSGEEVENAKNAISQLGGEIENQIDYQIPFTDITHRLVVIRKIKPTPEKYPRKFAKISASPL